MLVLFMMWNLFMVFMDLGENFNLFVLVIGVLEWENCDIFCSEIEEKIFIKVKK